jgi:hypothetical protein
MEIFITQETLEDVHYYSFLGTLYLPIERDVSTTAGAFLMFTIIGHSVQSIKEHRMWKSYLSFCL